jgi:hypothetical protein
MIPHDSCRLALLLVCQVFLLTSCAGGFDSFNLRLQEHHFLKAEKDCRQGSYEEAAKSYDRAAQYCLTKSRQDLIKKATCLLGEAKCLAATGNINQAVAVLASSKAISESLLTKPLSATEKSDCLELKAAALALSARLEASAQEDARVEDDYVEAVATYRMMHPLPEMYKADYADCLLDLATLLIVKSQTQRAESYLNEIVVTSLRQACSIATLQAAQAALTRCDIGYGQQAESRQSLNNDWHQLMADAAHAVRERDLDRAIQYYLDALAKARSLNDEKVIASTCAALGSVYSNKGDSIHARLYMQQALEIKKRLSKNADPGMDRAMAILVGNSLDSSPEIVFPKLDEWGKIREEVYGKTNPLTAQILVLKATLYDAAGQFRAAEPLIKQAQSVFNSGEANDEASPMYMCALGDLLLCRSDLNNSAKLYTQALALLAQRKKVSQLGWNAALDLRLRAIERLTGKRMEILSDSEQQPYSSIAIVSIASLMRDLQSHGKKAEAKLFASILEELLRQSPETERDLSKRAVATQALMLVRKGLTPPVVSICGRLISRQSPH